MCLAMTFDCFTMASIVPMVSAMPKKYICVLQLMAYVAVDTISTWVPTRTKPVTIINYAIPEVAPLNTTNNVLTCVVCLCTYA